MKGISDERALAHAKVTLSKRPTMGQLSLVRKGFPPARYSDLLTWIVSSSDAAQKLLGFAFPYERKQWGGFFGGLDPVSPTNEARWTGEYLLRFGKEIGQFRELAYRVDDAFLNGQRDLSFQLLDNVKDRFGHSFWELKRRIAFLQYFDGLQAQKKFTEKLKEAEGDTPVRYIAHYTSVRAEPLISVERFERQFRNSLSDQDLPPGLAAYLRYQVLSDFSPTDLQAADVLRYEFGGALIDQYEAFVSVGRMTVACEMEGMSRIFQRMLEQLAVQIPDPRLQMLSRDVGNSWSPAPTDSAELELYRQFRQGEYTQGIEKAQEILASSPRRSIPIVLGALCLAGGAAKPNATPANLDILRKLSDALSGGAEAEDAQSELWRFAWALEGSPISGMLRGLTLLEQSNSALPSRFVSMGYLLAAVQDLHPLQIRWMYESAEVSPDVIDRFKRDAKGDELKWITMADSFKRNDFERSLVTGRVLLPTLNPHYHRSAIRHISNSLIRLERIEEAAKFVTDIYISDRRSLSILPVKELVSIITPAEQKRIEAQLSTVVLFEMNARLMGADARHLVHYAYEDFLAAKGVDRPSKLAEIREPIEKKKYVFFLEEVCVESVMDTTVAFNSSAEVARERVEIYQQLSKLNPDKSSAYKAEMEEILRKLTVKSQLREIEQSKIRVDIDDVKSAARAELEDTFSRYQALTATPGPEEEVFETARQRISEGNIAAAVSLDVPTNERSALLVSMFQTIRDEFVSSNQHGLDGYLSVRIRHATLEGQLRRPFEGEALLTRKDPKTRLYKPNTRWVKKLGLNHHGAETKLADAFAKFSKGVDELIQTIIQDWLQIRKGQEGKGLFNFAILPEEIVMLGSGITPDMDLDDFVSTVVAHFMQRLDFGLNTVREQFLSVAKPRLLELLVDLQTDIQPCELYCDLSSLRVAIAHAHTNVQLSIDRIADWFRVPKAEKRFAFSIDDAITISTATVQAVASEFRSEREISADIKSDRLEGNFVSLVDILNIAFSNAARHSGLEQPVAKVFASREDDQLVIRVVNSIAEGSASESVRAVVDDILEKVRMQPFSVSVATEGGSGFYKMQKILHHDFAATTKGTGTPLMFGFLGDDSFFVEFKIPAKSLESVTK